MSLIMLHTFFFVSYIQFIKTAIRKASYSNAAPCIMLHKFHAVSLSISKQEYISRVHMNRVNIASDSGLRCGSELQADEEFLMLNPTRQESGCFIIYLTELPSLFFAVYYTYMWSDYRSSCKMLGFVMHQYAKNWKLSEYLPHKISTKYANRFTGYEEKSICGLIQIRPCNH